jgi:hypothetical protein
MQLLGTRRPPTLLALALSVFFSAPALAGGDSSTPPTPGSRDFPFSLYLSLSAGCGVTGPIGMANLTFGKGAFQLSVRASHAVELELLSRPPVELVEYSLMAGYRFREGAMLFHGMAGAGQASVTRNTPMNSSSWFNGDYETSHDETLNLPLQVGVAWDVRVLSIGPTLVVNINSVHSDFAVLLTVSIGNVRGTSEPPAPSSVRPAHDS